MMPQRRGHKPGVRGQQPVWAEHFRQQLRATRERLGLTQEQLAQQAGLLHESIAQMETGVHLPKLETAYNLARVLNLSVDELMGLRSAPQVVHYHVAGEVRVSVSNGGMVVLGNYGAADLEKLVDTWNQMRDRAQDLGKLADDGSDELDDAPAG